MFIIFGTVCLLSKINICGCVDAIYRLLFLVGGYFGYGYDKEVAKSEIV
jgi:hypothetical protein